MSRRKAPHRGKPRKRDHAAEWQKRRALIEVYRSAINKGLGDKCQKRGCKKTDADGLEYNHIEGRTWEPSKVNMVQRFRLYYLDYKAGKLSRLCKPHNLEDARARKHPVTAGKPVASVVGESVRAVRDLPKPMRPAIARRRIARAIVRASKRNKATRRRGKR